MHTMTRERKREQRRREGESGIVDDLDKGKKRLAKGAFETMKNLHEINILTRYDINCHPFVERWNSRRMKKARCTFSGEKSSRRKKEKRIGLRR